MGEQYLRYCAVTVEGSAGTMDLSNLRCRFQIEQLPLSAPAICKLRVTNLGAQKGRAIADPKSEYKTLTIDAGYESGHGIIFKGNIIQGIYGRESPTDTLTTIIGADGDHGHNHAVVSTTHPPGSTPQDHFNTTLSALGQFGVTAGYVGVDLSKPSYPRAVTLWGMARDVLRTIARSKDAMLFYDQQQVTMIPRGGARQDGVIVLNSKSGLVGMPTQTTNGILARCLIDPRIRRMSTVKIDQKDVQGAVAPVSDIGSNALGQAEINAWAAIATDGLYTVPKITITGDTRGNEWYMDLAMFAKSQGGPPPALQPYIAAT